MPENKTNPTKPENKMIETEDKVIVLKPSWRQQRRNMIINHEVSKFTRAFRENFATLIISALGLVAALSWNDAIKSAISTLFPAESDLIYKFYIAVVVTIISVVITYFISKLKPKN
jgi:hypothetical protein